MKTLTYIMIVLGLTIGTTACQKKSDRRVAINPTGTRTNGPNGTGQTQYPNQQGQANFNCPNNAGYGEYQGVVFNQGGDDFQFEQSVRGLLSGMADLTKSGDDPAMYLDFGSISGECGAKTGIFFNAKLNSVTVRPGQNNNAYVNDYSSQLNMVIFDSLSPTQGGIGVYADKGASGDIVNNQVRIQFYWEKVVNLSYGGQDLLEGYVTLVGYIDNQNFYGTIEYLNQEDVSSGFGGQSGTLGGFAIPTCSVFNCQ